MDRIRFGHSRRIAAIAALLLLSGTVVAVASPSAAAPRATNTVLDGGALRDPQPDSDPDGVRRRRLVPGCHHVQCGQPVVPGRGLHHRRQRWLPRDRHERFATPGDQTIRVFGKCLDVVNAGTTNGTPIQLWDCNGSGAQI